MLSFEPRIVVIDDKFSEVSGIIEHYQKESVGIKYFNAHLNNPDPKPSNQYSDLNLVFLDIHFTDNFSDYDPTHCAAWIDSLLPENSFYILVLWSKETDKREEVLNELKSINKSPFLCFSEQKSEYQHETGWRFDDLIKSIKDKIEEYPELDELANWKTNVIHSSNLVVGHLANMIEPNSLMQKLQKIVYGHGGKPLSIGEDNDLKREILFEALDSVLISNTKGLTPISKISDKNIQGLYRIPENVQSEIDSKLNTWFHFKLHKEPLNQDQIKPGILCKYLDAKLEKSYGLLEDTQIKKYLSHQLNSLNQEDSKTEIINITLLISRPCDIAQKKYGRNLKLVAGVLVLNPIRKTNVKKEFKKGEKFDCIKIYDHLQFSESDSDASILFDLRYVFSVPEVDFLNKFDNIKVLNKELLSEIQVEYASYSSRLGITQII